ncbi:hypothetical protein BTVI_125173 [Pitangus sulphuratus]|nr:hypothetical protein BTVI_125173 [Pitangus sulphuratus]
MKRDPEKLEKWAHENLMKFNKSKCKVLHLGQGNPRYEYKLGEKIIESSPAGKELGVLVDEKSDMSQQCVPKPRRPKHILCCITRRVASRSREVILCLYSALMRPHLEYRIQLWSSQHKKDVDLLEKGPEEGHEDNQRDGAPCL